MSHFGSRPFEFVEVDVFTDKKFGGNQLAVFLDGRGLSDEEMQAIGLEMNLSETTFIFPPENPDNTAKVRIFTKTTELPFAGHPTVGTAWVLANRGWLPDGAQELTLELGVGPRRVHFTGPTWWPEFIWMEQGQAKFGQVFENRAEFVGALGLTEDDLLENVPIQVGSTGISFVYVPLRDPETVDRVVLNVEALMTNEVDGEPLIGVFVTAPTERANHFYSRMIAAPAGGSIFEDPATGSASGPLGAYLVANGLVQGGHIAELISEQGTAMGRQSFVHIRVAVDDGEPGDIQVGGQVVPVYEGTLRI